MPLQITSNQAIDIIIVLTSGIHYEAEFQTQRLNKNDQHITWNRIFPIYYNNPIAEKGMPDYHWKTEERTKKRFEQIKEIPKHTLGTYQATISSWTTYEAFLKDIHQRIAGDIDTKRIALLLDEHVETGMVMNSTIYDTFAKGYSEVYFSSMKYGSKYSLTNISKINDFEILQGIDIQSEIIQQPKTKEEVLKNKDLFQQNYKRVKQNTLPFSITKTTS